MKKKPLQRLVDCWLPRLIDDEPTRRSFGSGTASPAELSRAVLMDVIAYRVNALYTIPAYPFAFPPELNGTALQLIQEVGELGQAELSGWALAGLQLWSSQGAKAQKRSGSYYTSPELTRCIVARAIAPEAIPTTVLDPACGGGAFLLAALERLYELQPEQALVALVNRLYGVDLDRSAVNLTRLALTARLFELSGERLSEDTLGLLREQVRVGNALVGSVRPLGNRQTDQAKILLTARANLLTDIANLPIFDGLEDGRWLAEQSPFGWADEFPEIMTAGGFGAVIGNPPYIGFNDYSGIEKAYFAHTYPAVYNLKSDLFYYFIARGIELLQPNGILGYVTSRFWKEAAFAAPLRRFLSEQTSLIAIEDLGGQQFFDGAQVDVSLLFTCKRPPDPAHTFPFHFEGRQEQVQQTHLHGGAPWVWLRRLPAQRLLLEKIIEQSVRLGEIAQCRTGVQTGLDEVFLLDNQQIAELKLEQAGLKRALKNRDIKPGRLDWSGHWLIYSTSETELASWPNIRAWLERHRIRLESRLRYDQAFPFWQLQWPRERAVFDASVKLVTPYKAPRNTFALDRAQHYFSTDVISVVFGAEWAGREQMTLNFLNSSLSTFQFRSFGKPVGGGQWDYYANPVKRLALPDLGQLPATPAHLRDADVTPAELDQLIFDWYSLNQTEQDLIRLAL